MTAKALCLASSWQRLRAALRKINIQSNQNPKREILVSSLLKILQGLSIAIMMLAAPTGFQTVAMAASCGGLNQKACAALKKGPRCQQFLRKKGKICRPCGGVNQRSCPVVIGFKICRPGLKLNFGKCVQEKHAILGKSKAQYKKWEPTIKAIIAARNIITIKQVRALVKARNPRQFQRALESNPRIELLYKSLKVAGFKTFTVALESSGSAGVGYARETGATLDVRQRKTARLYTTNSFYGGVVANVGNDLVFSAYTANHDRIGGKALGALGSFTVGSGVGVTIWYEPKTLRAIGFSINVGVGSVGAGGAVVTAKTRVY